MANTLLCHAFYFFESPLVVMASAKLTKSCPTHIFPFFFSYSTFIKKEYVSPLISRLSAILPSKESDLVLKEPVWDKSGHRAGQASGGK